MAHLPKKKHHEAINKYLDVLRTWYISASSRDAQKTPGAKALRSYWNGHGKWKLEGKAVDKEGWWYEITLQRAEPADPAAPALEVELEDSGKWWWTDIRPTTVEGSRYDLHRELHLCGVHVKQSFCPEPTQKLLLILS